jgi:crotonobetainyl-CoA:carnitine CoA-transferase CaiB-like acyl-CoA transferase
VLDGLVVIDLSEGVAGPIATMLLADQGAQVTKIERPGGDPTRAWSGARVWHRGKRSAVVDLHDAAGRRRLQALAEQADVVVESWSPGTAERLGADHATLAARNPRLISCSITAYGRDTPDARRPGWDALVAARTGLHWEQRGWPGGNLHRLAGHEAPLADLETPAGCIDGTPREGPVFPRSTWPSLGAAYCATVGISAALVARERTGRGQLVETSLVQGALAATVMAWQRVEDPDAPGLWSWVFDLRSPKGFFRCADGRWIQNWVPRPGFAFAAAAGDEIAAPTHLGRSRNDPDRLGMGVEDLIVLQHHQPAMRDAFARFPADEWVRVAAEANVPLQPVRTPEEALLDPVMLADGCVAEVDDPELGPLRQVGVAYRLERCPGAVQGPPPAVGEHTAEVVAEADDAAAVAPPASSDGLWAPGHMGAPTDSHAPPLAGVVVLDLGFAVAGPFGTQVLSDLGADVIKVNNLTDQHWHSSHIAFSCNRGKRSIAVDLKDPRGLAILHRLVERADVVHHNMRAQAAARLGIDDASLRRINPDLVYCHTRGFERDGPRAGSPGNDQTGAALAGVEWEDGGCADGGRPIWSLTSFGDTGNGFLSAIAVLQALYHRQRTGVGQAVDTSIVNAALLNTSYAWVTADGATAAERPHLDADQLGLGPLYRLYETADGWLCVAAVTDEHWDRLCKAIEQPELHADARFVSAGSRAEHGAALGAALEAVFAKRSAVEWQGVLDGHGVPAEVSSPDFALRVFDDPVMRARGWVTRYRQAQVGEMDQFGLLVDLAGSPGQVGGPPLVVGDHTREILTELGYAPEDVDDLLAARVVLVADAAVPPPA